MVLSRAELLSDPTLFSQNLDFLRETALFVRHTREDYRRASFLDGRMLNAQSQGAWISFNELNQLLREFRPTLPLQFIFHAGHVGSTLLSRLLEELPGVLALREPLPLRLLAEAGDSLGEPESLLSAERFASLVHGQTVLWRRGFSDTNAVIVKATSSAARLAPALLDASPKARAVCLNLRLEPYVATLLAGENSILDLRGHGAERMRRLKRFGMDQTTPLHSMSAGELAGLAWLTETLTQLKLAERFSERVLAIDFDEFLTSLPSTLSHVCSHFELDAPSSFATNAPRSPVLSAYAKAPDIAYSPGLRMTLLNQARQQRRGEIAQGEAWVRASLTRSPALHRLLPLSSLG